MDHKHNHDHEHTHDHCHEDNCSSCSCGHCHGHEEENSKIKIVFLIISAILLITAFVLSFLNVPRFIIAVLAIISALISGYDVYVEGIIAITKLKLDETTLMTIAAFAAIILGEYIEGAAVTLLFGIGELLEDYAVGKSRREISSLLNIQANTANLITESGATVKTECEKINTGSLLMINPHETVPIDGIIVEGHSYIDTSAITGEEMPLDASEGTALMSGMLNGDNQIKIKTTETFSNSAASRIIDLVEKSEKNKGSNEKLITRFARIYTPIVIIIAVLIAVIPSIITGDVRTWVIRALTCLVASCPCSIVISIPLAYFAGIGNLAKSGVLVKGGKFIEIISKCMCYAFDKTGTLTKSEMNVVKIEPLYNISEENIITKAASLEQYSSHPIAKAITEYAKKKKMPLLDIKDFSEIAGTGVTGKYNNNEISCLGDDQEGGIILKENRTVLGRIIIADSIREESKSVLDSLKVLGIKKLIMLTGDKNKNTKSVAEILNIEYKAALTPLDKVNEISSLKTEYGTCTFTGDGINDAPVLSKSSCGIAMGLGSDAAIESADIVLSSGNLKNLPCAIKKSRKTMSAVKQNLIFSLVFKAAVIILAALGFAPMWLAVLADTGVCMLCIINSTRLSRMK